MEKYMALFFGLGLALVAFTFFVAAISFWIWMLIDCVKYEPSEGNDKLVWIIIIIFTNWMGALIYYFVRRRPRLRAAAAQPPPVVSGERG